MIIEVALIRHVPGKLADVALRFEPGEPLAGFVLGGFQVWSPRDQSRGGDITVTYPSRSWTLPGGGQGQYVILRDSRTDKFLDPPESVALKAAIIAAYHVMESRGTRMRAAHAAALAPREAPRAPLRPRVAQPRGTIIHRVAPVHAQA